ncbi:hypothetical protein HYW55_05200 [Candidatus Gottesmanbacteria bacterium]|nr:hypothetical protein [Candidatus Gottesmanbacteria bacterium]
MTRSSKKIFSQEYVRWKRQLRALRKGKYSVVKKLALEAQKDLEMKALTKQLNLSLPN